QGPRTFGYSTGVENGQEKRQSRNPQAQAGQGQEDGDQFRLVPERCIDPARQEKMIARRCGSHRLPHRLRQAWTTMRHLTEVGVDSLKLFFEMEVSLDAVVPRKEAVLALAADLLAGRAGMSYEHARDALAGREKLGSTGLGRGVAMSHAIS